MTPQRIQVSRHDATAALMALDLGALRAAEKRQRDARRTYGKGN